MSDLDFKAVLVRLAAGERLSENDSAAAFDVMMSGNATPSQMGAFLMALRLRGETVEEITGAARTMRAKALPITAPPGAIDTVGTGGDGAGTFNISTAAALVVAGAGVPVAKHGNRNFSSKSGAADILQALGVNLDAGVGAVQRAMEDAHIGFLMAPKYHSAMRHVGPTRVELGTRTIFNLLGPISNPAGAKRQLVGVFAPTWVKPVAEVLGKLGSERAWVVHGQGLDELTTCGTSIVAELNHGKVETFEVTPEMAGLKQAKLDELRGGDPAANAATLHKLLDGTEGPIRDIVLLNAAAALIVAGKAKDLKEGVAIGVKSIASGAAKQSLAKLVAITNAPGANS
ncbi:MAG TPA: anthranilate phosphoribosyltransferase [Stellaceae bacterium]|jgi:anthranilate phosphoribosyltransferase|nr:anthranilate phosphoribosyltransferase [Stellaceae bacterium]